MDDYNRFAKTYLLRAKDELTVNVRMKEYIARVKSQRDRQDTEIDVNDADSRQNKHVSQVKQVLTDKGEEYCNDTIERWYRTKGIVLTKFGIHASQLNLVERTHQTIAVMVKTMMSQAVSIKIVLGSRIE